MPELPEVETIVGQLNKRVKGKRISRIVALDKSVMDKRVEKVKNVKLKKVKRRAKSIIMELDNGDYLLTHLRMTGHFHYENEGNFEVGRFHFSDGSFLTHNSIRKFGSMKLMNSAELQEELAKYGPEPLEKGFGKKEFKMVLSGKTKSNIKVALMDYKVIAGIGNIYAQEMLYHAGISPLRKVGSLSSIEVYRLYNCMKAVLTKAVRMQGSTVDNYSNLDGKGSFQGMLAVYGKEKCKKGHNLRKVLIGGRGTSYCNKCQR